MRRQRSMRFQILIVRGSNHLRFDRALEISDFLRPFVNQKNHHIHFRMIGRHRVGDLLENGGLPRARRGDNQPTRPFANRSH
jgi:hypothetical protein